MCPIGIQRSALRYPLDEVFGSAAHIRLIRVLIHDVETPLGVADAARLAGLTPAGARKALERLEHVGLVERVGSGRSQKWDVKRDHAFAQSLQQLFAREQERFDELTACLQQAVALPEVRVAWIEHLPLTTGEPLDIGVNAEVEAVPWVHDELRTRLIDVEGEFDLVIEVAVSTPADAPPPGPDAVFLWGASTGEGPGTRRSPQTHADADRRQLLMAEGVAELTRTDPSLIKRAKQHLDRLMREGQGTASGDIAEWKQLLEAYSPERVRDLLASSSSRAQRLRQSSPFFAVLTPSERDFVTAKIEKGS